MRWVACMGVYEMRHNSLDLVSVVIRSAKKYKPKFKDGSVEALLIEFFLETYELLKKKGLL